MSLRQILRRPKGVMQQIIQRDRRWDTILFAVEFANYEAIEGDFVEFGVFGGVSLAMLAKAMSCDPQGMQRKLAGFDSFRGLPEGTENHARWKEGDCAINHAWHPMIPVGAPITPQVVLDLFEACELEPPVLEVGPFESTIPSTVPTKYERIAILHVDCDLYESTREVLRSTEPALQPGTMVLFDDWFHYRGDPSRGEARAFNEFLAERPGWGAQPYRSYGVFGKAFILHSKS